LELHEIVVRTVRSFEERRYQDLMRQHHYLGSLPKISETLWYVATWSEEWVALLSFSASALKCAVRDRWIALDVCAPRTLATSLSPRVIHSLFWLLNGRRHKRRCRRHPRLRLRERRGASEYRRVDRSGGTTGRTLAVFHALILRQSFETRKHLISGPWPVSQNLPFLKQKTRPPVVSSIVGVGTNLQGFNSPLQFIKNIRTKLVGSNAHLVVEITRILLKETCIGGVS